MTQLIICSVDKIKGNIKESAKGTKYLENGLLQVGKNTVRASWLRPDESAIDRGGLVFAQLEVNRRDDKTYPQITIQDVVPVVVDQNVCYIRGVVKDAKPYAKLLSAQFEYEHTNWSKETNKATVSIKTFDKDSAIGKAIMAAKDAGTPVLIEAKLDPSANGFIEFNVQKIMSLAGGDTDGLELTTAADGVPAEPTEEDPF